MIIPTVRCSLLRESVRFYTEVLDFQYLEGEDLDADPSFAVVTRDGAPLFLSSHRGDGVFGQAVVILVDDVDAVCEKFRARGLERPKGGDSPVHEGPVDQSWGTREFYVDDPDGNTLRFTQGFRLTPR